VIAAQAAARAAADGYNFFFATTALLAPAGAPGPILRKVNRDVERALADPEIVQRLREFGIYAEAAGTPEALARFIQAERQRWSRTVREIGMEPE
jgi:tripartite-type tricarboxylate transporter receptor subunit TctC